MTNPTIKVWGKERTAEELVAMADTSQHFQERQTAFLLREIASNISRQTAPLKDIIALSEGMW